MIINTANINEAKKLISKSKSPIAVKAQNLEFNRKILDYGHFDILLSIEKTGKREALRQKDSGLNEVLARIASKNGISLGIDMEELSKSSKKDKAFLLERIAQNIKICRKTKTKIKLFNIKDKRDSLSLLISLGASSQQAREAVE